ncbi:MAG TPA: hypothetical protein VMF12_11230 [Xanthobacteraceae bacterium]|nr:hypothetical protein [Xanthobacteraceae bacterium]
MPGPLAKWALVALVLLAATSAQAQHHRRREPRAAEPATPPVSVDKRDSIVAAPGAFSGRPYWLALAECGGIYFKLNVLYTDAAVRARVVKPDPHANAEYTKKLNEAISIATAYFSAAETFLRTDRGLGRDDAILTYDPQSRAAGDREKTIDAALAAAKACPALYHACRAAYPKACGATLAPMG